MQVLAILRNHFDRILHLDGSGARDEAAAAGVLREAGLLRKGGFHVPRPAGRWRRPAGWVRRGSAARWRCWAAADLDLRGRTALEPEVTLEVLVARLSRLHRR